MAMLIVRSMEENQSFDSLQRGIVDQTEETPLLEYKDRFFAMFESALMSSNEYNGLRLSGLKGLELMVLSRNYLSANEVCNGNPWLHHIHLIIVFF